LKCSWYAASAVGLTVLLAACTPGGTSNSANSAAGPSSSPSAAPSTPAAATGRPFGAACAQLPATGPGSLQDMSRAPTATAASTDPLLTTLAKALTAATLVDTLNTTDNITVLAPSNTAFQALPDGALEKLMADVPRLTAVLTHHVVPGRRTPEQLTGRHATLDNDSVTIEGTGEGLTISGDQTLSGQPAHVVCGDIPTANATVYVIDQVLKPQQPG
jgi:uncharacterized surface protein with fasciclin (FAS1) repeats